MTHPLIQSLLAHARETARKFVPSEDGAFLSFRPAPVHAGTVTVDITRSSLQVGPETVVFEVSGYSGFVTPAPTGTFDERFHDFAFLWSFGDPGSEFTVPERLPTQHRNANVGYGPEVAHTYGPGEYTASVLVVEVSSGRTAYWEQTFTVADPDVFFAGKTITVNPDGGADHTSITSALTAARSAGDVRRVQLARGKTYDVTSAYSFADFSRNVYVSAASGAGAKPVILRSPSSPGASADFFQHFGSMGRVAPGDKMDVIFSDVVFAAGWNPQTESGDGWVRCIFIDEKFSKPANWARVDYFLLHNCEARGLGLWVQSLATDALIFSNCSATDWLDYGLGLMGDGSGRLIMLGTKSAQNPLAISGGPKDFRHNAHGPSRIGSVTRCIIDGCDFFSANGWFPNVRGWQTIQHAFRWSQSPESRPDGGDRLNLQRSIFEGGGGGVFHARGANGYFPRDQNVRIEKSYFLGGYCSDVLVNIEFGGYTIRNNVMVHPNPTQRHPVAGAPGAFLFISGSTPVATRVLFEHNTLVDLHGSGAAPAVVQQTVAQTNVISRNNLHYAPNRSPAVNGNAPLSTAVVITPYNLGHQRRTELFTASLGADVVNGATLVVNYSLGEYGNGVQASYESGSTLHNIQIAGTAPTATFAFGASSVTITNTSGVTWTSGQSYSIELERAASALPPFLSSMATPAASGSLYLPLAGSAALNPGGLTPAIRDDYFGTVRPAGRDLGAIQVTT